MMCPSHGAWDWHQWHFEALTAKLWFFSLANTLSTVLMWSSKELEKMPTPLTCALTSGMSLNDSSIAACAHEGLLRNPIGGLKHLNFPNGVTMMHMSEGVLSSLNVWNCMETSNGVTHLKFWRQWKIDWIFGDGWWTCLAALFDSQKSAMILHDPSGLGTTNMGIPHSVERVPTMIPSCTCQNNSFFTVVHWLSGTAQGCLMWWGFTPNMRSMWHSLLGNMPSSLSLRPSNDSKWLVRISWSVCSCASDRCFCSWTSWRRSVSLHFAEASSQDVMSAQASAVEWGSFDSTFQRIWLSLNGF